jgi:hypothetical protein
MKLSIVNLYCVSQLSVVLSLSKFVIMLEDSQHFNKNTRLLRSSSMFRVPIPVTVFLLVLKFEAFPLSAGSSNDVIPPFTMGLSFVVHPWSVLRRFFGFSFEPFKILGLGYMDSKYIRFSPVSR